MIFVFQHQNKDKKLTAAARNETARIVNYEDLGLRTDEGEEGGQRERLVSEGGRGEEKGWLVHDGHYKSRARAHARNTCTEREPDGHAEKTRLSSPSFLLAH